MKGFRDMPHSMWAFLRVGGIFLGCIIQKRIVGHVSSPMLPRRLLQARLFSNVWHVIANGSMKRLARLLLAGRLGRALWLQKSCIEFLASIFLPGTACRATVSSGLAIVRATLSSWTSLVIVCWSLHKRKAELSPWLY